MARLPNFERTLKAERVKAGMERSKKFHDGDWIDSYVVGLDEWLVRLVEKGSLLKAHQHYCFIVSRPCVTYAFSISRRDSTRSIRGLMPSSLEIDRDSSSREITLARSPSASRSLSVSA